MNILENQDNNANTKGDAGQTASSMPNFAMQANNTNSLNNVPAEPTINPTNAAGQTTDHINLGNPNKDEQIEVRTPNFARQHVLHLLILFGLVFVIFTFVFQVFLTPVAVVGRSMVPTLNASSTGPTDMQNTDLIYSKPSGKYKNGDIIITDESAYPLQTGSVIKRVIATEGQTLTFKLLDNIIYSPNSATGYDEYTFRYTIWLNDVLLDEEYLNETDQRLTFNRHSNYENMAGYCNYKQFCESIRLYGQYSITLEPNYVFVMGDNRNISIDSRYFGAIHTKHITGKLVIHIPNGTNFFIGIWNAIFNRNKKLLVQLIAQ